MQRWVVVYRGNGLYDMTMVQELELAKLNANRRVVGVLSLQAVQMKAGVVGGAKGRHQ